MISGENKWIKNTKQSTKIVEDFFMGQLRRMEETLAHNNIQ
jgi:hypothetical protein